MKTSETSKGRDKDIEEKRRRKSAIDRKGEIVREKDRG